MRSQPRETTVAHPLSRSVVLHEPGLVPVQVLEGHHVGMRLVVGRVVENIVVDMGSLNMEGYLLHLLLAIPHFSSCRVSPIQMSEEDTLAVWPLFGAKLGSLREEWDFVSFFEGSLFESVDSLPLGNDLAGLLVDDLLDHFVIPIFGVAFVTRFEHSELLVISFLAN